MINTAKIWRGLALALLTAACSESKVPGGGHSASGYEPESLLTLVGFDGAGVKPEKRFAGYAHEAHRISLIDPEAQTEAWGLQMDQAYDMAAPLPGFAGVAVLTGQSFKLLDQRGREQDFATLTFPIGFVQRAAEAAAYSMA
jgi:hypothetical protein